MNANGEDLIQSIVTYEWTEWVISSLFVSYVFNKLNDDSELALAMDAMTT